MKLVFNRLLCRPFARDCKALFALFDVFPRTTPEKQLGTQEGQKYGYDTEAFAIYDTIKYVNPPVHTVAVGTAWGEAAMLLASGEKGHRAALPSASIMIKQPINAFRGQASELEIQRKEIRNTKQQTLDVLSKGIGKPIEEIEKDINRPKYFNPWEAVEYGIIDQVLDGAPKK